MWSSCSGKASKVQGKANIAQTAMVYCNRTPANSMQRNKPSEVAENALIDPSSRSPPINPWRPGNLQSETKFGGSHDPYVERKTFITSKKL